MKRLKLGQLRTILSVVQVALALATVALAHGTTLFALAAVAAASTFALSRPPRLRSEAQARRSNRGWTVVVFAALVVTVLRAVFLRNLLEAGVDFVLLLVVQRLFNRQKTREHMQLLLLGAVLMVIGAVINAELNYPILLAIYLPTATLALVLNVLLGEAERLGERVAFDLRRDAPRHLPGLVRSALYVALATGLSGLFVFVAFPRVGVGFFLRGNMEGQQVSGFSDSVALGGFGRIKEDPTVIMRIFPSDMPAGLSASPPARVTWHIRGSAFDRYTQGEWKHSSEAEPNNVGGYGQGVFVNRPRGVPLGEYEMGLDQVQPTIGGWAADSQIVRGRIVLEEIGTDLLFAPSVPLAIRLRPRGTLERENRVATSGGVDLQMRLTSKQPGPVQYEFTSLVGEPTLSELRDAERTFGRADRRQDWLGPYLRVEGLSDEFVALADRLEIDQPTQVDRIEAVLAHLKGYGYTTDLQASERVEAGADPVEGFLFETKEGHCEYFATSMALLLREMDVPTRVVNGYYGAHRNSVGDFYAVRQADAHSWVEVWIDGIGWTTFDPTPPAGRTSGRGPLFPNLAQWADALRNAYLGYVIDFDLGDQAQLFRSLGLNKGQRSFQVDWSGLLKWVAVFIAFALALRLFLRRRRGVALHPASRELARIVKVLRRHGFEPGPSSTPRSIAGALEDTQPRVCAALLRFAASYETARFGRPAEEKAAMSKLRALADLVIAQANGREGA